MTDFLLRIAHRLLGLLELLLLEGRRRRGGARRVQAAASEEGDRNGCHDAFHCFFPLRRSSSSRRFFLATPQAYPPRPPSVRTARWQGTSSATGLAPQALPTARTAAGAPMARAMS